MDSGQGGFEKFDEMKELLDLKKQYPNHGGIFKVGELLELKGSKFRVKSIKPTELRLKLLRKE